MNRLQPILFAMFILTCASPLRAGQISPSTQRPPPPPAESEPPPEPPSEPVFDPLHAAKDIEVGTFYLKKGDVDAAIDRFEEAAQFQPGLAKPWELLGEAYEKKREYARAVESYQKYLKIFPGSEDAAKVKKRIALLEPKAGRETANRQPH